MEFIRARWYTALDDRRQIDLLVVHDMEAPEKGTTAEAVARYFATTDRKVSAHYCIDNDSIVQCVEDNDVAWHAPGANHNGIGLEHAGYASQTREQWLDPYGEQMLALSAGLAARLCDRYAIPVRFVTADGLKAGRRGVTTHAEVSRAFGGTHWDPGPGFPMDDYLARIAARLAVKEGDMHAEREEKVRLWVYWRLVLKADPARRPAGLEGFVPTAAEWSFADWCHNLIAMYGPHTRYLDWRDWRVLGLPLADRPATAPATIPPRWWDGAGRDHTFARRFAEGQP